MKTPTLVHTRITTTVCDHKQTGRRFRHWREAKGVSLRELAPAMQKDIGYLSCLERGKRYRWTAKVAFQYQSGVERALVDRWAGG